MNYNFDRRIERRGSNAIKWDFYPADVLPLWVADMDFPAPEPILAALRAKVEHGIFGYESPPKKVLEVVAQRMANLYGWQVTPEMIVLTPGVITGFNLAARATCQPGDGILIQPPVYPPFLSVHENVGLVRQYAPLTQYPARGAQVENGHSLHYEIDFDAFEAALNSGGARTRLFLLCQPHNPTGQIYTRDQLTRMAEICLKNNILICSDEIHSELLLGGAQHISMATLSAEIAARTITLVAPSKTFNVAGLHCAFAIIPDADLRQRYKKEAGRLTLQLSSLGLDAAQAAFSGECDGWLDALLLYLTANRDALVDFVAKNLPGIRTTLPEATYLAWLDCNDLLKSGQVSGSPYKFFLHKAKVALNDGATFGPGGEGFVRLNFGCPRATLMQALERMKAALQTASQLVS
ncbi:MAG: PatB family C-S lyase [Chloroflexi bacterium]|nr:PatB family C-S lyase [Chloroflexota bacterium]